MKERLQIIITEIRQKCKEANCYEFDCHWEFWGVMWYPWFFNLKGSLQSFSLNDINDTDMKKLCTEGLIELVKEYLDNEKDEDQFDKKKYRLVRNTDNQSN